MRLGIAGIYQPKWTVEIHNEWQRNLLLNDPDLTAVKLQHIEFLMNKALPDANVTGYETLIPGLDLPDVNDRHVLAAAIRSNSEVIVTANLKDFPADRLSRYDIEAIHPDEFIADLFDLNSAIVLKVVQMARTSLKNPPFGVNGYLEALQRQGLPMTVKALSEYQILL